VASRPLNVDEIYQAALECARDEDRDAYLDAACGENTVLRRRVVQLLEASANLGSFLDSPAPEISMTVDHSPPAQPGTRIGPYKLLERIGEGGMGVVWMVEQLEPVRRRAALKVIKPGMDSRQVIARFEAERQALSLMDHPNIARVLDAGRTDGGLPYFVMELVKGQSIATLITESNIMAISLNGNHTREFKIDLDHLPTTRTQRGNWFNGIAHMFMGGSWTYFLTTVLVLNVEVWQEELGLFFSSSFLRPRESSCF